MPRIAVSTEARSRNAIRHAPRAGGAGAALCAMALAVAAPPAAAATGPAALDRAERAVIAKINAQRSSRGLRQLRADDGLARAADAHSADMRARGYFGHDTLGGPSWSARVRRYVRARALGEVIGELWRPRAPGPRTEASRAVRMWMKSPSHRAVLLSPGLARLGVARRRGRSRGGVQTIYTVDFASRR